MEAEFFLSSDELALRYRFPSGARKLSFAAWQGDPSAWRQVARPRLAELIGLPETGTPAVQLVREIEDEGVRIAALRMSLGPDLSLPGYLLQPLDGPSRGAVMAIHGHGQVEPSVGLVDDYHHRFALRLAQAGYLVLCPELRGFGALQDLAAGEEGRRLDYWVWPGHHAYSLVTTGLLTGQTMIGETVADLLRWENWLATEHQVSSLDVAGISYGGDLALTYPVFSARVRRILASGTLGSFAVIFDRCYNAPAHVIPGVLNWFDRSDIAGLNAPRPILVHYGARDVPGPDNYSASYNETVPRSLDELRAIYAAFGAGDAVRCEVTPDSGHEMDIPLLLEFLQ